MDSAATARTHLHLHTHTHTLTHAHRHTHLNNYLNIQMLPSSSCFTLAVPRREVSCVGYTSSAWEPRFLQFLLDGPMYCYGNYPHRKTDWACNNINNNNHLMPFDACIKSILSSLIHQPTHSLYILTQFTH